MLARRLAGPALTVLLALPVVLAGPAPAAPRPEVSPRAADPHWVATWYGAPQDSTASATHQSYRMIVHGALGGRTVRLRLSNRYGTGPLRLSNVSIARPVGQSPQLQAGTLTRVTFGGSRDAVIPAGGELRSDPVAFRLPGDADVAVSFDLPGSAASVTQHPTTYSTSWVTLPGDGGHATESSGAAFVMARMPWSFLTGLEVDAAPDASTVVALGDSITDSVFQVPNGNTRWPDLVNDRIAASDRWQRLRSLVNAGISGNMVTADRNDRALKGEAAVTRMAWDVLDQPSVSHVVVFEGINDVGAGVDAATVIAGLRDLVAQAHRRGLGVIVATLTPTYGSLAYGRRYHDKQAVRSAVNRWIRTSGVPDDVLDFSAAVSSGTSPESWLAALTADFLHPNPGGLEVMARAFPLRYLG
ncbi:MAG: GDSL-type esterase/lipase family protein [Nocardioides sp.]